MGEPGDGVQGDGAAGSRSAARLSAVQALYEIEMTGAALDSVLSEFIHRRWTGVDLSDGDGVPLPSPDGDFFGLVVRGTLARQGDLDAMINDALQKGWTVARLEAVLRAMLRAGAFELLSCRDVPARVVINEYVSLAGDFFLSNEPGLVNGVLDRLARVLRTGELTEEGGGGGKA